MITVLLESLAIVQVDQHIRQKLVESVFNRVIGLLGWVSLLLLLLAAVRLRLILVSTILVVSLIVLVIVTGLVPILTIV